MTKKEQKQWNDALSELIAYNKEQAAKKDKCLTYVESEVSKNLYPDIVEYIEDCDSTDQFSITSEAPDDENKQEEGCDYLDTFWVDQYCNGGYMGDDYAGWIHIKINKTEYLKFHYSM